MLDIQNAALATELAAALSTRHAYSSESMPSLIRSFSKVSSVRLVAKQPAPSDAPANKTATVLTLIIVGSYLSKLA